MPGRLAIVAGWYDVVCFKQYKCYANMMTGNTLNLCMKIGNGERADVALISAAIANFIGIHQSMRALRSCCNFCSRRVGMHRAGVDIQYKTNQVASLCSSF